MVMEVGDETLCKVEAVDNDVVIVNFRTDDGVVYRGALLRVKSWPCPTVPPLPPAETQVSTSEEPQTATTSSVLGNHTEENGSTISAKDFDIFAPTDADEQLKLSSPKIEVKCDVESPQSPVPLSTANDSEGAASTLLSAPSTLLSASTSNGLEPVKNGFQERTSPESTNHPDSSLVSSDFAALQHRWSYFQKNPPNLPRKNIASRREKERLEQVPKLRPRNFLCAKCKFAMPGFSSSQCAGLYTFTPDRDSSATSTMPYTENNTSASYTETSGTVQPLSPSHARKRKVPQKRTIVRPLYMDPILMRSLSGEGLSGITGGAAAEDDVAPKHSKNNSFAGDRRGIKRSKHGGVQKHLEEKTKNKATEDPHAVATIVSSPTPSGEGGLKMKFKLGTGPSTEPAPKRRGRPKASEKAQPKIKLEVVEKSIVDESKKEKPDEDDEFAWPPKLRIDDSIEGADTLEKVDNSPPPVQLDRPVVPTLPQRPGGAKTRDAKPAEPAKKRVRAAKIAAMVTVHTATAASPEPPVEEEEETAAEQGSLPKPVARPVDQCVTKEGRSFAVGDLVWGKLSGYPWWPGKINHIIVCDDPVLQRTAASSTLTDTPILQYQEAQIEWFGPKSSISYIEVNKLCHYAEDYDKKYKPKQKNASGAGYNEAIKAANAALQEQQLNGQSSGVGHHSMSDDDEQDIFSQLARQQKERERQQVSASGEPVQPASRATQPSMHLRPPTSDALSLMQEVYSFDDVTPNPLPPPVNSRSHIKASQVSPPVRPPPMFPTTLRVSPRAAHPPGPPRMSSHGIPPPSNSFM